MKTKKSVLASLIGFALLLAESSGATTLTKMAAGDMALDADVIVTGTCISAASQNADGALVTVVEVSVDETIKGATNTTLNMVIPGGVDSNRPVPVAVIVPGAPSVFQDENVLLFLRHSTMVPGAYDVVGFSQGVYEVVEDANGNKLVAQGRFNSGNAVSLEQMKAEIEQALQP